MSTPKEDYEIIYLEPISGPFDEDSGRTWASDKPWNSSDYDGCEPTKYARADLFNDLKAENAKLQKIIDGGFE